MNINSASCQCFQVGPRTLLLPKSTRLLRADVDREQVGLLRSDLVVSAESVGALWTLPGSPTPREKVRKAGLPFLKTQRPNFRLVMWGVVGERG